MQAANDPGINRGRHTYKQTFIKAVIHADIHQYMKICIHMGRQTNRLAVIQTSTHAYRWTNMQLYMLAVTQVNEQADRPAGWRAYKEGDRLAYNQPGIQTGRHKQTYIQASIQESR